jgi:hypothetical protein
MLVFGVVYSWGFNLFGECGLGNVECRLQPFPISSLAKSRIEIVSAGHRHALAVTSSMLIKIRNDPRYKRWFDRIQEYEPLKTSQPKRYEKIRAKIKNMMKRAHLDPEMLDCPDKIVNVDVSEVKEAKDALENGEGASSSHGDEKKKSQLKFREKKDMSRFPRYDTLRIDKKAIVVRRIMKLQDKTKYNNEVLRKLCSDYAVDCDLSFERFGQGKPITLELLAIQMILEEHGAPTMKMILDAEEVAREKAREKASLTAL